MSEKGTYIDVICPHCGFKNRTFVTSFHFNRKIILCDCAEGGCDEYFVIMAYFNPEIKTYKLEECEYESNKQGA